MNSLVIGGAGQLGSNLARVLLDHGHSVRIFHRRSSKTMSIEGLPVERVEGDLNDGASIRRACKGVQVVYHAAGYYPTSTIPVDEAKGQALKETHMLLEAVRSAGNERLVYASTLTTIGRARNPGHLANESRPFSTRYTKNPYLMAKAAMETTILESAAQGVPAVVVIPTVFFGPYDQRPTSGTQILLIAQRRLPVYVPGLVNVIDVRDVAVAMMRAAERGKIGERYVVGNWNTTQGELNQLIADIAGVAPPVIPAPLSVARVGAKTGEWICRRVLRRASPLPACMVEVLAHMQHYDCTKAFRELEYPRSSVDKALEDALGWFRDNGYLPNG